MPQDLTQVVEWLQKYNGAVTAVASAVIALLTLILAWISWRQTRLTRILQRAYLSVEAGGIVTNTHGHLLAYVLLENVGHLPASNLSWVIEPVEVTSDRDWRPPAAGSALRGLSVLPLGGRMTLGSARISQRRIDECVGDGKFLYVWGRASYRDGFARKREAKFCHRYNWEAREIPVGGGSRIGAEHARYHDFGNEAD
jgi:hypothetical protein